MKILVIGATGYQGGHVARHLLKKGHTVHAFTRNSSSPAAQELVKLGAVPVLGNLEDSLSIEKALDSVDAVFGMSTPFEINQQANVEQETQEGIRLADAVKKKNTYMVFSSVSDAPKKTGVPHFDSKYKIEQHIQTIGAEVAILGPVYFMENLLRYQLPLLKEKIYSLPLPPDRKLAQIALDDLAAFAVLALENKNKFVGKRIDLASDELTGKEAAGALKEATGKSIEYLEVPIASVRKLSEDSAKMYEWFNNVGYSVDIPALKKEYPEIPWHTFKDWAKEQNWKEVFA